MKILIASHGKFAEGIISAANIIVGNLEDVTFINAYVDGIDFKKELKNYFDKNKDVLVLTDLFGGSVNQEVMQYIYSHNLQVITGINLPLILEILIANNNGCLQDVNEIVKNSQTQLIYVNETLKNMSTVDDFD